MSWCWCAFAGSAEALSRGALEKAGGVRPRKKEQLGGEAAAEVKSLYDQLGHMFA